MSIDIRVMNFKYNKREYPYDFIVDRRSPLGNPYIMEDRSQRERDRVCNLYISWLEKEILKGTSSDAFVYLMKLLKAYKKHGRLRLFCYCSPKRCHAETIRFVLIVLIMWEGRNDKKNKTRRHKVR